jgi:hypothetical protein
MLFIIWMLRRFFDVFAFVGSMILYGICAVLWFTLTVLLAWIFAAGIVSVVHALS